jgi:tol-pal system protein YbgF
MMRRTVLVLALGLLTTGCSSGLIPARGPEPDDLAEIKGRILELQRTAAMTRVEIDRLRQQVVALESRLEGGGAPPAAAVPAPTPSTSMPPVVSKPPVRPAPPTIEVTALEIRPEERVPQAVEPPPPPSTLYHQGRYVDAEAGFRRFLQAYPDTSLSDNAQFWIGESRFARGDFDGALAAFREVAQRYPGGNKVADSLLKAAGCLQRLGDAESARSAYDEVIQRFPGSAAAAMAEERRGQLPR